MATTTINISLTKPELADTSKIREDINSNSDIIDGRFSATYMAIQAKNAVTITGGSITGITDLVVSDGGTGVSTLTDGGILLGSGTGAITAMAVLTDGQMIVGDGTTDPVAESGATLRTSIGCASRALDNIASCAINTSLLLGSSDGGALGSATKMWSDLFLANGGVINFNNGNVTLTHSSNTLTLGGGNLALGANSLTMTGSLAATANRVTKGWFTDLECTNSIAGDITGNSATTDIAVLATTFTCTDNENEALACPIIFVDGATGAQGAETDGDLTYNPSTGTVTATSYSGDGSNLTGVGAASATALTISAKVNEAGGIAKGQPVYFSGATGQIPQASLADNTVDGKTCVAGIAAETKTDGQTILVRAGGELDSVNTSAYSDGDCLYLSTAGSYSTTVPTSGAIIIVAGVEYSHASLGKLLLLINRTKDKGAPSGTDLIVRMGDNDGTNKTTFKDYANNEVAYIDSDGKADFTSLTLDTALSTAGGGTGVANNAASTITITGNYATTFTLTNTTGVTLPTTGTLATLAGTEAFTNKTLTSPKLNEDVAVTTTATKLNYITSAIGTTGTTSTNVVFSTSPTFITPTLGAALATSISTPSIISTSNADITIQPNGTGDTIIYAPSDVVTTVTAAHTMTIAEAGTVLVSCAATPYTITLPTASGHTGLRYHFIKTDANYFLITLDGNGAETFNYESSTSAPVTTYARLNTYCAEVTIVSNGTNWQVIDEAMGQVPECLAYLSTNQSIPNTTVTTVELNLEDFDIGNNFNTTTHIFTAPISGKYSILGIIRFVVPIGIDKVYQLRIVSSGANYDNIIHSSNTADITPSQSLNLQVSATDEICLQAYHNSGESEDIQGHATNRPTILNIRLISKD